MKLICFILFFVFSNVNIPDKRGEFKFNEEIHDFGHIPQGKPVTCIFIFKNIGELPLIIFEVKPICGCTIADYTKKPVKKNEVGFVKITFHAITRDGFNKAVVINSNSKAPTKYLTIKGEVY